MRRAARVDATQQEIVNALRQVGARVWIVGGAVDLVVLYRGDLFLIDAKGPNTPRTSTQQEMVEDGWPIEFPTTDLDALRAIGIDATEG